MATEELSSAGEDIAAADELRSARAAATITDAAARAADEVTGGRSLMLALLNSARTGTCSLRLSSTAVNSDCSMRTNAAMPDLAVLVGHPEQDRT